LAKIHETCLAETGSVAKPYNENFKYNVGVKGMASV